MHGCINIGFWPMRTLKNRAISQIALTFWATEQEGQNNLLICRVNRNKKSAHLGAFFVEIGISWLKRVTSLRLNHQIRSKKVSFRT